MSLASRIASVSALRPLPGSLQHQRTSVAEGGSGGTEGEEGGGGEEGEVAKGGGKRV